jgi:heme exporter protein A
MQACRLAAHQLACRRGDRLLLQGLDFALHEGEALHVAGPNGIGKSSLIRLLAGLLSPFAGTVDRHGALALADERAALDPQQPLGEALGFWAALDAAPEIRRTAAAATLGLAELLAVPVRYLSTGQRKRAVLGRVVASGAPIWLLDEPLNGLDAAACSAVERMVADHCDRGGIAVIASHQALAIAGLRRLDLDRHVPADAAE